MDIEVTTERSEADIDLLFDIPEVILYTVTFILGSLIDDLDYFGFHISSDAGALKIWEAKVVR